MWLRRVFPLCFPSFLHWAQNGFAIREDPKESYINDNAQSLHIMRKMQKIIFKMPNTYILPPRDNHHWLLEKANVLKEFFTLEQGQRDCFGCLLPLYHQTFPSITGYGDCSHLYTCQEPVETLGRFGQREWWASWGLEIAWSSPLSISTWKFWFRKLLEQAHGNLQQEVWEMASSALRRVGRLGGTQVLCLLA